MEAWLGYQRYDGFLIFGEDISLYNYIDVASKVHRIIPSNTPQSVYLTGLTTKKS